MSQQQLQQQQQSVPISQHDELIRYIREAWNKVSTYLNIRKYIKGDTTQAIHNVEKLVAGRC